MGYWGVMYIMRESAKEIERKRKKKIEKQTKKDQNTMKTKYKVQLDIVETEFIPEAAQMEFGKLYYSKE